MLLTGVYQDPTLQKGAEMTATAFGSGIPGAEILTHYLPFAYSTMIPGILWRARLGIPFRVPILMALCLLFVVFAFIVLSPNSAML